MTGVTPAGAAKAGDPGEATLDPNPAGEDASLAGGMPRTGKTLSLAEMEPTPAPFVRDPLNPTDAELRAAIDRGVERGDILLWDDIKDEFAARYGLDPDDLANQDDLGDEDAEVLE